MTTEPLPDIILKAQRDFEIRQRQLAEQKRLAAAVEAEKAATAEEAMQRLLGMIGTLPDSKDCPKHPGQTAVFIEEATSRIGHPVYRCPLCVGDSAAIRRQHLVVSSGIPADVRHATLENFDLNRPNVMPSRDVQNAPTGYVSPHTFLAKTKAFVAKEVRNLVLCGETGIGKGHLAAAVAIAAIDAGYPVAWTECSSLFRAVHASYSKDGPESLYNRYAGAVLLVLDEICFRDLPSDGEEIIYEILNRRHKSGLQSILLGNASAEKVREWLGTRIVDRLRSGNAAFCYGKWDSMRGEAHDGAML